MKKKSVFCALLVVAMALSGCGGKPESALIGTWKMARRDGTVTWFVFLSDNMLNVNNEIWMRYFVTSDKKIVLGEEAPAPYSIKNGTLTIKQEHSILTLTKER
ncbi:MAG: hypothetical protein LBF60_10785 [Treponema sp.]|jgi:hypothetical protein|nr:hypothetical protein [Treponema sp.]